MKAVTLLRAMDDPKLFAPWFGRGDWSAWRAFLTGLFGLPMDDDALAIFRRHTSRTSAPTSAAREAWLICGRRGGKSLCMALLAVYVATFRDYRQHLQPGERATVAVLAADRKQARTVMRYVAGLLRNVPMLAKLIERETTESFDLAGSVTIEVTTASSRATRGYTFAAVLADEVAFWPADDTAADPDTEILNAVRPGMATIPDAMLICASSPYARKGELWNAHERYYGRDDAPVLVWQADTRSMNPSVPQRLIDEAYERDPASAAAEYGAQFRTDVEQFIRREVVEACTDAGVFERRPQRGVPYIAFTDPSGGSSDSFTLAIAHHDPKAGHAILDCVREIKPPFSPERATRELAAVLAIYGIKQVFGDRYAGEWPREAFRARGITYRIADRTRSELYLELLPKLNSRAVRLLDHPKLQRQLIGLERRTSRAGRDSIDHRAGAHDDVANAVAGVLVRAALAERSRVTVTTGRVVGLI